MNYSSPWLVGLTLGLGALGGGWAWRSYKSEPPPPPPTIEFHRTVTWFMAHPDERLIVLTRCNDNPGSPNAECVNADYARLQADAEDYIARVREKLK